jgi:hypothetical protein
VRTTDFYLAAMQLHDRFGKIGQSTPSHDERRLGNNQGIKAQGGLRCLEFPPSESHTCIQTKRLANLTYRIPDCNGSTTKPTNRNVVKETRFYAAHT